MGTQYAIYAGPIVRVLRYALLSGSRRWAHMEIEAKYRVVGKLSPQRITSFNLQPYTLSSGKDERHHDTLLDTSERAVTGAGYALRIREAGKRRILTLKGPP